jgi:hypothetical protein
MGIKVEVGQRWQGEGEPAEVMLVQDGTAYMGDGGAMCLASNGEPLDIDCWDLISPAAPSLPKVRVGQVWTQGTHPCRVTRVDDGRWYVSPDGCGYEAYYFLTADGSPFPQWTLVSEAPEEVPPPAPVVKVGQVWDIDCGDSPTYSIRATVRTIGEGLNAGNAILVSGGYTYMWQTDLISRGQYIGEDGESVRFTLISDAPDAPAARKVQVGDVWINQSGPAKTVTNVGKGFAWFEVGDEPVILDASDAPMHQEYWTFVRAAEEPDYGHDATHPSPEQFEAVKSAILSALPPPEPLTPAERPIANRNVAAAARTWERTPKWALDPRGRRQGPGWDKYTRVVLGMLDASNMDGAELTLAKVRKATDTEAAADMELAALATPKKRGFLIECDTRDLEM